MAKDNGMSGPGSNSLKGLAFLLVDRNEELLRSFQETLASYGAAVYSVCDISKVKDVFKEVKVDVFLADMEATGQETSTLIRSFRDSNPGGSFFLLIDRLTYKDALSLTGPGADDYFFKPLDPDRFAQTMETSLGQSRPKSRSLAVIEPYVEQLKPYIIFRSPEMKQVLMNLPRIASSNQTVLISGETGTGKEIVARAIHVLSRRAEGNFVAVNCGAIPDSLMEGELFGHEKGAFTGAHKTHRGKFELADNGTLLLDEIGDMPLSLQVKLLRVLEEGVIYRLGGERPTAVNVRILAATRRDLMKSVREGLFRDDLFYRLNVLRIHLPPLRKRIEDIPLLSLHFLHRSFYEMGITPPYPSLSSGTIDLLQKLRWRGNVRELRNLMARIATLLERDTKIILPIDVLPFLDETSLLDLNSHYNIHQRPGVFIPLGTPMEEVEETMIRETLKHTNGNRTQAARILKIGLRTLRRKLNKYSI